MSEIVTPVERNYWLSQTELAKTQTESLRAQERILKKQNQILESQSRFSKAVMLATIVLALGTFLTLTLEIIKFEWKSIVEAVGSALSAVFAALFFTLFCAMGFLLWYTMSSWNK